jgi:hypothetical protein
MSDNFVLSRSSNQPTTELTINFDSTKIIQIYGDLYKLEDELEDLKNFNNFIQVIERIKGYKNRKSKVWFPDYFEVTFNQSENIIKPKPWPNKFPDLTSTNMIKHSDTFYSIFVNYNLFEEFLEYFNADTSKAVEINHKKMYTKYYLHLPNIYREQIIEK